MELDFGILTYLPVFAISKNFKCKGGKQKKFISQNTLRVGIILLMETWKKQMEGPQDVLSPNFFFFKGSSKHLRNTKGVKELEALIRKKV